MPKPVSPASDTQQVPLRLPRDLVRRVDERRAQVGEASRNAWIERVIEWALDQPVTNRTSTHPT